MSMTIENVMSSGCRPTTYTGRSATGTRRAWQRFKQRVQQAVRAAAEWGCEAGRMGCRAATCKGGPRKGQPHVRERARAAGARTVSWRSPYLQLYEQRDQDERGGAHGLSQEVEQRRWERGGKQQEAERARVQECGSEGLRN